MGLGKKPYKLSLQIVKLRFKFDSKIKQILLIFHCYVTKKIETYQESDIREEMPRFSEDDSG